MHCRPIEVHSHDPLRYLGDMLAWVHQSIATEKEIAVGLFGPGPTRAPSSSTHDSSSSSSSSSFSSSATSDSGSGSSAGDAGAASATPAVAGGGTVVDEQDEDADDYNGPGYLLDRIFEGVVRPLKVRIDQVLISCQDTVLLFKLADMIGFYGTMVASLLGANAGLSKSVTGAHEAAQKRFYDLVKQQAVAMLQSAGRYPADLMPPRVTQETLTKLVRKSTPLRCLAWQFLLRSAVCA
jgi:hypothetical protein